MEILAEIGLGLFFFGACCMDSVDLTAPACICLFGLALTVIGMAKGGRA